LQQQIIYWSFLLFTTNCFCLLLVADPNYVFNQTACAPLNLLAERGNSTRALILRNALNTPKGKKEIAKSDKLLLVDKRPQPIVKRIQVEAAQEYASRADVAENAPGLFPWTVKNNNHWGSSLDSCADVIGFFQRLRLSLASNHR
jgi:hypothetical protein